jgi:hypothetical protein
MHCSSRRAFEQCWWHKQRDLATQTCDGLVRVSIFACPRIAGKCHLCRLVLPIANLHLHLPGHFTAAHAPDPKDNAILRIPLHHILPLVADIYCNTEYFPAWFETACCWSTCLAQRKVGASAPWCVGPVRVSPSCPCNTDSYHDADDLDKQLLLSIQYACNEAGLRIPWESVAKLMGEKFSDGAIVQHMSKLRQKMVENNLPVPPPLKRGTTVVPSKIYASSATARRKSMPDTPTSAANAVTTPQSKVSTSKKRNRRSGFDSDSDSQPDENDMDIADTSDEEYGASGRKKKKPHRQAKFKPPIKKKGVQESMEFDDEDIDQVKDEDATGKHQAAEDEMIKEAPQTPGPASRTRGVRPDYSKLEQGSDNEDANDEDMKNDVDDAKDVGGKAEDDDYGEAVNEAKMEEPRIKSDGEVSPRSRVPASPATPTHMTVTIPRRFFCEREQPLTEHRTCPPTTTLLTRVAAAVCIHHTLKTDISIKALKARFQEFHQSSIFHAPT